MVAAVRAKGFEPAGRRALVVGAGGAGTAIAHAVASEGVSLIAVADIELGRRDDLVSRLRNAGFPAAGADAKARDFDIVINATPVGMRSSDVLPADIEELRPDTFIAEVVTMPEVTPFLRAARAIGCRTSSGNDMFEMVAQHIVGRFVGEG